ncbi:hypothetical protein AB0F77_41970 [Streptomyces sp. NPDC026672]
MSRIKKALVSTLVGVVAASGLMLSSASATPEVQQAGALCRQCPGW